jgi:hypothetical protein
MAINVEVSKNGTENNLSLIRKFTKRVQGSGVLPRVRGLRYAQRKLSEYVRKKKALKRIKKIEVTTLNIKMGKHQEKTR